MMNNTNLQVENPIMNNLGIHEAAKRGQLASVRFYLEQENLDVDVKDEQGWTPLHKAAYYGQYRLVKYLVEEKNADLEKRTRFNWTPLHAASDGGHLNIVKFLVQRNAQVDATGGEHGLPLFHAIANNHTDVMQFLLENRDIDNEKALFKATQEGKLEIVKYFVEEKKVDIHSRDDSNSYTPLHTAAYHGRLEVVKYLVEKGAKINYKILNHDWTPFNAAAERGHVEVVKFMTANGAEMNFGGEWNFPLGYARIRHRPQVIAFLREVRNEKLDGDFRKAADEGNFKLLKFLLTERKNLLNSLDRFGSAPLHHAIRFNRLDMVRYLVESQEADVNLRNNNNLTPMHEAASNKFWNIVKYLIEKKADVEAVDDRGENVLDYAIKEKNEDIIKYLTEVAGMKTSDCLHKAAKSGQLEVLRYLLEERMEHVNSKDNLGWTALHKASFFGRFEVVKYLVDERGAQVNIKNKFGWTPLHAAAEMGHLDIVKFLVEMEADIDAYGGHLGTVINYAKHHKHYEIVKYLKQQQGHKSGSSLSSSSPSSSSSSSSSHQGTREITGSLQHAAENGQLDELRHLLEVADENVNSKDRLGWTALHKAAFHGHLDVVKYLVEERGARVNVNNKFRWTPLHGAAERGHMDIVKYLVEKRANINAIGGEYGKPVHYAKVYKHIDIVRYLKRQEGKQTDESSSNDTYGSDSD